MVEQFYSITHLTTEQLRELFSSYYKYGWIDYEYEILCENNPPIPSLTEAEIILNIQAGNKKNYLVFMIDHEDEEDGVMIGFGLTYHDGFSVYLHLPPIYLKEMIEKYSLECNNSDVVNMTVEQFLIEQLKDTSLN